MNASIFLMCSILLPAKGWFAPDVPWAVKVVPPAGTTVTLVLNEFTGQGVGPAPDAPREFRRRRRSI